MFKVTSFKLKGKAFQRRKHVNSQDFPLNLKGNSFIDHLQKESLIFKVISSSPCRTKPAFTLGFHL